MLPFKDELIIYDSKILRNKYQLIFLLCIGVFWDKWELYFPIKFFNKDLGKLLETGISKGMSDDFKIYPLAFP